MEDEQNSPVSMFIKLLGMDERSATLLANEGLTSIEELAYVPIEELAEIEGLGAAFIEKFRQLAREHLIGGLSK
jgi:transcription termination/antitermination protein NusA